MSKALKLISIMAISQLEGKPLSDEVLGQVQKEFRRVYEEMCWLDDVRRHLIDVNDSLRQEIKALKGEK